jgi:hypothetical protein
MDDSDLVEFSIIVRDETLAHFGVALTCVDGCMTGTDSQHHVATRAFLACVLPLTQVNATLEWAKLFRGAGTDGGDVMFTMGSDFHYQAPHFAFDNMVIGDDS